MRPTEIDVLLHCAYAVAARGTCPSIQVGCVIARASRILSTGYNGAPSGMPHCDHATRQSTLGGDPNVPTCVTAIHAESNAIAFAARHGTPLHDAMMVTTLTPCRTCAQLAIQAGITTVVCDNAYRDISGVQLLRDAGVDVTILELTN
jgi:dCMP deaminase